MVRRKHKLYFEKTASKFPIIIFSISILIGGFFLFRIIATLVRENNSSVDFTPVEEQVVSPKIEKVEEKNIGQREVIREYKDTSISAEKPAEKPVNSAQIKQVQSPVHSEFYSVQVASFRDIQRAENLVRQLKKEKISPLYIKTRGKFFQVYAGRFESVFDGNETLLKIRQDFSDAFLRRLHPPFEEK